MTRWCDWAAWLAVAHTEVVSSVSWSGADAVVLLQLRRPECQDGDVRLSGTRPELFYNQSWTPVCGHFFWSNHDGATTFCQQLGYDSGRVALAPEALPVDAVQVGKCGPGERLDRCTKGHNSRDFSAWCRAGNYNSLEVNCSLGDGRAANSSGESDGVSNSTLMTSSCRGVEALRRWGEGRANMSQAKAPTTLPKLDETEARSSDRVEEQLVRRETPSSTTQQSTVSSSSSQNGLTGQTRGPTGSLAPQESTARLSKPATTVEVLGRAATQQGAASAAGVSSSSAGARDTVASASPEVASTAGDSQSRGTPVGNGKPGILGANEDVGLPSREAIPAAKSRALPPQDQADQTVSPADRADQSVSSQNRAYPGQSKVQEQVTSDQGLDIHSDLSAESRQANIVSAANQDRDAKLLNRTQSSDSVALNASSLSGNSTGAERSDTSNAATEETKQARTEDWSVESSARSSEKPVQGFASNVSAVKEAELERAKKDFTSDFLNSTLESDADMRGQNAVVGQDTNFPNSTEEDGARRQETRTEGNRSSAVAGMVNPLIRPTLDGENTTSNQRKAPLNSNVFKTTLAKSENAGTSGQNASLSPLGSDGANDDKAPMPAAQVATKPMPEDVSDEAMRCEVLASDVQWVANTTEKRCLVLDDDGDWGVASWVEVAALAQHEVRCEDACCAELEKTVLTCCGVTVAPTALRCGVPPPGASYVSVQVPGTIAAPVEPLCAFANMQLRCPA